MSNNNVEHLSFPHKEVVFDELSTMKHEGLVKGMGGDVVFERWRNWSGPLLALMS